MTHFPRLPSAFAKPANQNRPAGATPEDALILWLLRLPDDTDPAHAAAALLAAGHVVEAGEADAFAARFRALLEQVARCPRDRLFRLNRPERRIVHLRAPVR